MRRLSLAAAGLAAAAVLGTTVSAQALPAFKGAGYSIKNVARMTVTWHVPSVTCAPGESADAVVVGMMGPAVGTLDGWNAASTVGCDQGRPWYRIQTWVNAIGGGHAIAPAAPGDLVQASIVNASSSRPTITVTDLTHPATVSYKLRAAATTVSPGAYAGARVPTFSPVNFKVSANNYTPISRMTHARHVQYKGNVKQIGAGYLWSDGMHYSLYWKHS